MDFLQDTRQSMLLMQSVPYVLTIALNVITVLIVYEDKKKLNIKTPYVIVATILYRPLGVCAFLLYCIYNRINEQETEIK